jgi:D-xylonolactonase
MTTYPEPELIVNGHCHIAENPLWHPTERKLYYLDIPQGTIFRWDANTGTHEVFYQGDVMGGFTFQTDGSLLLFGIGAVVHRLQDGRLTTLVDPLPGEEHNRFNDIIADPIGRVICGTMPYTASAAKTGSLYLLNLDGTVKKLLDDIQLTNGMGFSPDHKTFYHTDSPRRTIKAFDYDVSSGEIANGRLFTLLPEEYGSPDGLTVDTDGFIWSANWGGSQILRYDPQGNVVGRIGFPTPKVSSLTFGGDNVDELYVTTAGGDDPAANGDTAGGIFRVRVGIQGIPEFMSRILV